MPVLSLILKKKANEFAPTKKQVRILVMNLKKEFALKVKEKVVVEEQSFVTKKKIEPYLFMDLQKKKRIIYQPKNFLFLKNYPKSY